MESVDAKELTAMISYTQKNDTAAKLATSLYHKLREMGRIGEFLDMAPDDLRDLGSVDFVDLNQTDREYLQAGLKKILRKAGEKLDDLELKALGGPLGRASSM